MAAIRPGPRPRIVLLGASNLTLGFAGCVEAARAALGGPLEVLAAIGNGRSFGMHSSVLGRGLPPIVGCGLWKALDEPRSRTLALITDVGNDVAYEAPVERIVDWVGSCLRRLRQREARTVMTLLPLDSVQSLGPLRFYLIRTLFFPGRRISLETAGRRVLQLQRHLERLAGEFDVPVVQPPGDWYGFDPIHVKRARRSELWREVLCRWPVDPAPRTPSAQSPRLSRLQLALLRPERWWLLGRERGAVQPAGRLPDGTTIALY